MCQVVRCSLGEGRALSEGIEDAMLDKAALTVALSLAKREATVWLSDYNEVFAQQRSSGRNNISMF